MAKPQTVLVQLAEARGNERREAKRCRRLILRAAELGHTHAEIAGALGVSPQAVSKWLRKERDAN